MNKKAILNIFALILFLMIPMTSFADTSEANHDQAQKEQKVEKRSETSKAKNGEPGGYDEVAHRSMITLAIGILMGLATLGGTIGQGFVGASAINGIAKNPGAKSAMQTMLILIMVLIESIVIYALVVAILLFTKL